MPPRYASQTLWVGGCLILAVLEFTNADIIQLGHPEDWRKAFIIFSLNKNSILGFPEQ